jgi:hypothetical protein
MPAAASKRLRYAVRSTAAGWLCTHPRLWAAGRPSRRGGQACLQQRAANGRLRAQHHPWQARRREQHASVGARHASSSHPNLLLVDGIREGHGVAHASSAVVDGGVAGDSGAGSNRVSLYTAAPPRPPSGEPACHPLRSGGPAP